MCDVWCVRVIYVSADGVFQWLDSLIYLTIPENAKRSAIM